MSVSLNNKDPAFISHTSRSCVSSKVSFVDDVVWNECCSKIADFLISLICSVSVRTPWSSEVPSVYPEMKWYWSTERSGCKHYDTEQRTDIVVWCSEQSPVCLFGRLPTHTSTHTLLSFAPPFFKFGKNSFFALCLLTFVPFTKSKETMRHQPCPFCVQVEVKKNILAI